MGPERAPAPASASALPLGGLWHSRDFLKLWGGETVSQLGAQITVFALPLVAILSLDASPAQVGILSAAQFAPVVLITLFAGVWLDTHRRRPVLVYANVGRAVVIGLVPLLFVFDMLSIEALCAVAAVVGLLTAAFDVAYVVYLPTIVRDDHLVEANAKLEASYSIAEIGGPGLGGALIHVLAAPFAIVANAVSYVVGAISVASIRREERAPPRPAVRASMFADIREGFGETLRHPVLRALVLESSWFNLFERAVLILYLLYGLRTLELSAGVLGAIMATGSIGAFAGAAVARWSGRRFGIGRTVVWSIVLGSAALALLPLAERGSQLTAAVVLVAGFVLYGLGLAVFNVYSLSIRAQVIPPELFGRVTATYKFMSHGTIPVGALVGGVLAEAFGVRAALTIAGAALVAGSLVFALARIRHLSEQDLSIAGRS